MSTLPERQSQRYLKYVAPVLASLAIAFCLYVLAQWTSGFFRQSGEGLDHVPMAPLTAIAFLITAIPPLLRNLRIPAAAITFATKAAAGLVMVFSIFILAQFFNWLHTDVEGILTQQMTSRTGIVIGRMSPITAGLFLLTSISLFISGNSRKNRLLTTAEDTLSFLVFGLALTIVIGYWYGAPIFYGGTTIPVALLTGASFLAISSGLLFNSPDNMLHRFVSSPSLTARISRRIIPILLIIVLSFNFIEEYFETTLATRLTSTVVVGSSLITLAAIIVVVSLASRRTDIYIARQEKELRDSEKAYRDLVDNSLVGVSKSNLKGDILFANAAAAKIFGFDSVEEGIAQGMAPRYKNPADRQILIQKLMENGRVDGYELEMIARNGEVKNTLTSAIISGDTISGIVIDVTERKQSEDKFKSIFDASVDGILLADPGTKRFFMGNRAIQQMLGYTQEELTRLTITDIHPEEDLPEVIRDFEAQSQGLSNLAQDIRVKRKDGRLFYVDIKTSHVTISGKNYMVGIFRDATERRASQAALIESEKTYRSLFENMLNGFAYCRMIFENGKPVDFIYLSVNAAFADLTGLRNVTGRKVTEIIPGIRQDNPEIFEIYGRVALTGKPERLETFLPGLQMWFSISVYSPEKEHFVAVFDVITERKETEERLRSAEENFRHLSDITVEGVVIHDKGKILLANRAFASMVQHDLSEIIGKSVIEFTAPEYHNMVAANILAGRKGPYEAATLRRDGTTFINEVRVTDVEYRGQLVRASIIRDMTEQKAAQEKIRAAEENYRNSLDESPLGIRIVTSDGELLYANKAVLEMYDYTSIEQLKNTPARERYTSESYKNHETRREMRRLGIATPPNYEVSIVRRDGEIRHLSVSRKEVTWNGKTEFQTIYQDITEHKQAEERLRISEQNFRNMLESQALGCRIYDGRGNVLYANPALAHLYGYDTVQEFLSVTKKETLTPDSYQESQQRIQRAYGGSGMPKKYELSIVRKDGQVRHLEAFTSSVFWGGKTRTEIMYQDITERKAAEISLKESEEKFRSLFDHSPVGMGLSTEDGKLIDVNDALVKMHGYETSEEFVQSPLAARYLELEDRNRWIMAMREKGVVKGFEVRLRRKDGTIFWASFNTIPQPNTQGELRILNVVQDITERKLAEEQLKRAAAEWQTTFDSFTDMVSIHDTDYRILRVNKAFAAYFDLKPEELIGRKCYEVMHNTKEPIHDCPYKSTLAKKAAARAEFFEGRYFEAVTSPILNGANEVIGCVHVTRDISEQKKMQENLIITDRMASIGQLASGIAHEINNPLTGIIGFSELLLSNTTLSKDVLEDLTTINKEAKRTANIVKGLLTFARRHKDERMLTNINSTIEEVLRLRSYEHNINNIHVKTSLEPNLPEIQANGAQLLQVFMNLIVNAEQAMTEAHGEGTLKLTTERLPNAIKISITDDGMGISPDNIKKLFTPFFTTKEPGKGTGLGLSISHGIVTDHNGKIYAESEEGKGATFIVELPINGN